MIFLTIRYRILLFRYTPTIMLSYQLILILIGTFYLILDRSGKTHLMHLWGTHVILSVLRCFVVELWGRYP